MRALGKLGVVLDWIDSLRLPMRWCRTRLSSVSITAGGIRVRNFPGRPRVFPRALVDRFDWDGVPDGKACMLILNDGGSCRVWGVDETRPGSTTVLNNLLRQGPPSI